jgi:hypothetical protein
MNLKYWNTDSVILTGKWTHSSTTGRAWQVNYTKSSKELELMHSPSGTAFTRLAAPNVDLLGASSTNANKNLEWQHMAVVYDAGTKTLSLFLDGTLKVQITNAEPIDPISNDWHIGGIKNNSNGPCEWLFDDIRLTVGAAIYTQDFAPPGEFPTSVTLSLPSPEPVIREWTDDSNEMGGDNDADLS